MGWQRVRRLVAVLGLLGGPLALIAGGSVSATTFTVVNNNDSGSGSLRQAIFDAATSATDDTITVTPGIGAITLATPISFVANGALSVQGNGVTIDANGQDGAIRETSGTGSLTLDGITVENANATGTIAGAIVAQATGDLTLSNCVITHNTATGSASGHSDSGAVVLIGRGSLNVSHCSFTANTSSGTTSIDVGGAIDDEGGTLTIDASSFAANHATSGANSVAGGSIDNEGGSTTIVDSSITSNAVSAGAHGDTGGGIVTEGGPLSVTNSTISANGATGAVDNGAGGILSEGGDVTLVYATVTSNTPPAGDTPTSSAANLKNDGGALDSFVSVLASAAGAIPDCIQDGGPTNSSGYNFSDDSSCGFVAATDQHNAGSPGLGTLGSHGGAGDTQLPQSGSKLLDAIPPSHCNDDGASEIATDERGVTRPQGSGCDIGASEARSSEITPTTTTTTTSAPTTTTTAVSTGSGSGELPRTGANSTPLALVGALTLLLGGALLAVRRRRGAFAQRS